MKIADYNRIRLGVMTVIVWGQVFTALVYRRTDLTGMWVAAVRQWLKRGLILTSSMDYHCLIALQHTQTP